MSFLEQIKLVVVAAELRASNGMVQLAIYMANTWGLVIM